MCNSAVSYGLDIQLVLRKTLKRSLNRDQKCFDGVLYEVNRTHLAEVMVYLFVRLSISVGHIFTEFDKGKFRRASILICQPKL
jgi:hypothetical protein